jgi:hypothetical protein
MVDLRGVRANGYLQKTENYEGIYDVCNVCHGYEYVEDSDSQRSCYFMHIQSRTEKRKSLLIDWNGY